MRTLAAIFVAVILAITTACDRSDAPRREGTSESPAGNTRPPIEENHQLEPELKDAVWRLTGPYTSLRYDRGGILFITERDGTVRIVDLDGASEARFSHSGLLPDSTYALPGLRVNTVTPAVSEARMVARDKTTTWILISTADNSRWILVVPR